LWGKTTQVSAGASDYGSEGVIAIAHWGFAIMEPVALTGDASLGVLWWILGDLVAILAMFFIVLLHRRKRA
jgi:hypothetical protein